MWRKPQVWLGVLISIIALFLAFRGIEWNKVGESLAGAQYIWLIPSALALLAAIWARGVRWQWLFGNQRDHLPRSRYVNATAIGYLITNIFPLRLGELARIFFIARDGKQSYALAVSTIVVEHVLDVLVVLGILLVILITGSVPVPEAVKHGALIGAVLFGGVLVVMLLMVWQRQRVLRLAEYVVSHIRRLNSAKWLGVIEHLLDGFSVLQPGLPLLMVLCWSVVGWLLSAISLHFCLLAFIPGVPPSYSLFATVASTFVLLLPATPGAIGTLDAAIKESLVVFGVDPNVALSAAIVFHGMEIIIMDVVGVICLLREAGSWAKAKESLRSVTTQAESKPKPVAATPSEKA